MQIKIISKKNVFLATALLCICSNILAGEKTTYSASLSTDHVYQTVSLQFLTNSTTRPDLLIIYRKSEDVITILNLQTKTSNILSLEDFFMNILTTNYTTKTDNTEKNNSQIVYQFLHQKNPKGISLFLLLARKIDTLNASC